MTATTETTESGLAQYYAQACVAAFERMCANSRQVLFAVALLGMVQCLALWTAVAHGALALWYGVLLLSQCLRHAMESRPVEADMAPHAVRAKVEKFSWLAVFCGLVQCAPLLHMPVMTQLQLGTCTIFYLGLMTSAVNHLSGQPQISRSYVTAIATPVVLAWLLGYRVHGDLDYLGVAGLCAMAVLMVMGLAAHIWVNTLATFRMRDQERHISMQSRLALEATQNAMRAKSRFFAAANHDLRQPLHTISLLTGVLKMRSTGDENADVLSMLSVVVDSLTTQLDDLLDLSKLDAGVVAPALEPFALGPLLRDLFEEARVLLEEKGLHAELLLCGEVVVKSDVQLLTRVLRNLINNAIKFTEHGHVTVSLDLKDGQAQVSVADSGIGIDAALHADIYQEFYQVNNPQRDRRQGMGLGLSIVQRLVALLNLKLAMQSTPGAGTTFTLTLPLAHLPVQRDPSPPRAMDIRRNYGLQVLLVEDELMVQKSMLLLLNELGCHVRVCDSTSQARALAQQAPVDFVIADFRLHDEDHGLAAIAAVREVYPKVPAVMISGDTAQDRLRMVQETGLPYLSKPIRIEELVRVMDFHCAAKPVR